jgi:hypothetical protein
MAEIDPNAAQQLAIRRDIRINNAYHAALRLREAADKVAKALKQKNTSDAGFHASGLDKTVSVIMRELDMLEAVEEVLEILDSDVAEVNKAMRSVRKPGKS